MIFVGLDPSFKHFGISYINDTNKEIILTEKRYSIESKSFKSKFQVTSMITNDLFDLIKKLQDKGSVHLSQEVSTTYNGWYVAELYGIACSLFNLLTMLNLDTYMLHSQGFIKTIHGKKVDKTENVWYVERELLPLFEKYGYNITREYTKKTSTGEKVGTRYIKEDMVTDGEADSFLYTVYQFVLHSENKDLVKEILDLNPKFAEMKELS